MGNNNRLAHRYWKKGLIILAGIWAFILIAAAGESIHRYVSVPAHQRTLVDLQRARWDLTHAHLQLDQVVAQRDMITVWAECLEDAIVTAPRPRTIDFLDVRAKCNDPR